jgi:hypothetical protein
MNMFQKFRREYKAAGKDFNLENDVLMAPGKIYLLGARNEWGESPMEFKPAQCKVGKGPGCSSRFNRLVTFRATKKMMARELHRRISGQWHAEVLRHIRTPLP